MPIKQTEKNMRHRDKSRDASPRKRPAKRGKAKGKKPKESDPKSWLLYYMPGAFPLPFGMAHDKIVSEVVYAIKHGGNVAIAAPRGTGKSTLVNGLVLWALLTKQTSFPVVITWDDKAKKRALRFWQQELCFNEKIHEDYPEQTDILHRSRGIANRLSALTEDGKSTGARISLSEGMIVLPNGLGAIGSATINGNPRGLNYATIDGKIIRPSFATIDDPQDRETARSRSRVSDTLEIINGDIAGMAGPDERMPMVMPCTVIERKDVADLYLSNPDWRAVRVGQVLEWPEDFHKKKSDTRRLWNEWNVIRQDGEKDQDGGKAAVEFYLKHKAALTKGMTVSWESRYDKKRGQPDALYSAIHDYFQMGHEAFMAERQNDPVEQGVTLYTLTPQVIQSRTEERKPGYAPEWVRLRVAATDLNPSYGYTWGVGGFRPDQSSGMLAYGVHETSITRDATEAEVNRKIYEELIVHGRNMAALPCRPELWLIDASGAAFNIVLRFCVESVKLCGLQATPCTGRGSRQYRPYGKTVLGQPKEQCHMAVDSSGRKWVAYNADYWREVAQKAWTGSVGAPGSCSLPDGNHATFAEQICREKLSGKGEVGGQTIWTWETQPGPHDYGDVMQMLYMGAAWCGIGSGASFTVRRRKRVKRNKVTRVKI